MRDVISVKEKRTSFWNVLFFAVLWIIYTALTTYLFYHQAIGNENWFHSDVKAYILEMQGLDSGYEFPYPVLFKLGALFDLWLEPEMAITVALVILNSLSPVVLKYYLDKYLAKEKDGLPIRLGISVLVFALLLVSMLFPLTGGSFPGTQGRYKGVFTPNPHHNATYLAARPFAILCFFQFAELLQEYEKQFDRKKGVSFGVCLLLATMTKPSFTLVLVATAGVVMVYRLLKERFGNLKNTVLLGICFLPTFGDLLYQFGGVFGPKEGAETGVGFGWLTAWSYHCNNIPVAILAALAFPFVVFLLHHKEWKGNQMYRFSVQFLLMSLGMVMLMYEKGFRVGDMNFSWGYMYGMFFAFVGAAVVMVKSTVSRERKWYLLVPQWVAFLLHLGCGLLYFKNSLAGLMYY